MPERSGGPADAIVDRVHKGAEQAGRREARGQLPHLRDRPLGAHDDASLRSGVGQARRSCERTRSLMPPAIATSVAPTRRNGRDQSLSPALAPVARPVFGGFGMIVASETTLT